MRELQPLGSIGQRHPQSGGIKGLAQEIIGAPLNGLVGEFHPVTGHDHHRRLGRHQDRLGQQVKPVTVGQFNIQQDQIRLDRFKGHQGISEGLGLVNFITGAVEVGFIDGTQRGAVFYYQYLHQSISRRDVSVASASAGASSFS